MKNKKMENIKSPNEHGVHYAVDSETNWTGSAVIYFNTENGEKLGISISSPVGTHPTGYETREDIVETGIHMLGGIKIGKPTPEHPYTLKWE